MTGCCVPARDVASIVNGTIEFLLDKELAQKAGAAGRALVRERFDKERMAKILLEDYLSVLQRKNLI